jgi:hypothetical protein
VFRARQGFRWDDDPDAPALMLAVDIVGGGSGLSNRLITRLRQKEGLSYGVGAGLSLGSRERLAMFSIGGIAAPQNVNRAEQALREELERARKEGFTEVELEDAKKGQLQSRLLNRSQDPVVAGAWINNLDLGRTFNSRAVQPAARRHAGAIEYRLHKYIDRTDDFRHCRRCEEARSNGVFDGCGCRCVRWAEVDLRACFNGRYLTYCDVRHQCWRV